MDLTVVKYLLVSVGCAFIVVDGVFLFFRDGRAVLEKDFGQKKDDLSEPQARLMHWHRITKKCAVASLVILFSLKYIFGVI